MLRRCVVALLIALAATPVVLNAQGREIVGRVHDATGAAIPGIEVAVLLNGEVVRRATSDADGRFRIQIDFAPDQPYEIRIRAQGFADLVRQVKPDDRRFTVAGGNVIADVNVERLVGAAPQPPPPPPPPPVTKVASPDTHDIIPVFYATDRERAAYQLLSYGTRREPSQSLHLGRFDVSIPRRHDTGSIERPTIWTLWREDPDKHLVIIQRVEQSYEDFYRNVADVVANSSARQVFVFIHGYNVPFDDAIYRTAQLSHDLNFAGASILYSWPSEGMFVAYGIDANNAEWTAPHLRWFLEDVAKKSGADVVHVIGHSMGNRPLVNALNRIAHESPESVRSRFNQVVLTAPDIDADVFRQLAEALPRAAKQVTLYASSDDFALRLSERFQGYQRAGDTVPNVTVVNGVNTIDASAVDTSLIGHSYYADARSVLTDLSYLLRLGLRPDQRANLLSRGQPPSRYWVFRP